MNRKLKSKKKQAHHKDELEDFRQKRKGKIQKVKYRHSKFWIEQLDEEEENAEEHKSVQKI